MSDKNNWATGQGNVSYARGRDPVSFWFCHLSNFSSSCERDPLWWMKSADGVLPSDVLLTAGSI